MAIPTLKLDGAPNVHAMLRAYTAPWTRDAEQARYDSATIPTHFSGGQFRPSIASAVGHLPVWDRQAIVNTCQGLGRNNPVARTVIARCQEFTVGDGPTITVTCDTSKRVGKRFKAWAEPWFNDWFFQHGEHDTGPFDVCGKWNGVQWANAVQKAWLTDGDCLTRMLDNGTVQTTESLLVRSPGNQTMTTRDGNPVVDGVNVDSKTGQHLAYHLGKWGVTDTQILDLGWIPASANTIWLPNPDAEWIGGVRGEPGMQSQWENLTILASFIRNSGVAAQIATYYGILIASENPGALKDSDDAQAEGDQPSEGRRVQDLYPGMVRYMQSGDTVTQIKPEFPQQNFREFVTSLSMMVGAEFGLPVSMFLYDARELSWSQIKSMASLAAKRWAIRQDVLQRAVRRMFAWRVEMAARASGIVLPDDWKRINVKFPAAPILSFNDEVKGYKMAIETNMMTLQQAGDALGTGTADELIAQRGAERKAEIAAGVVPLASPGSTPYVDTNRDGVRDVDQMDPATTDTTNE